MPELNLDLTDSENVLPTAEFEVEGEDIFHMKNLYKLVHDWFMIEDYVSVDGNDDKVETLYFERTLPSNNKENHIWWRVHKAPKGNPYYKYFIRFDYQTLNMGKTEITVRGQKFGTNKGNVIIRCSAYVMLDYAKAWRNHPFLKLFHKLWKKYVYKKKIQFLKDDLWIETYRLQDTIKKYLKFKNPYEMQKLFHPELGV